MFGMDNTEKKTYGLLISKKSKKIVSASNVFGDDSEDSPPARKLVSLSLLKENNSKLKRDTQLEIDKALSEDPNIYDYDGIYDSIKADKVHAAEKSKDDKAPKYIHHLMKAAEARKQNQEKLAERKVQKEREMEGDDFNDKEVFVTGAYKQKMLEMQELEEEEKRRAEMEAKMDVTKQNDLSGFYRHLLDQQTPVLTVKRETTAEFKVSQVVKTNPKEPIESGGPTSTDKNVDEYHPSKCKDSDRENDGTKRKGENEAQHDTKKTPDRKSEMLSEYSSNTNKLSSAGSSSKDPYSRESEINESSREYSKRDQKKKFEREKLQKSLSPSSSESVSSDSESGAYKSRQKKSEKYSKYEHSRRRKKSWHSWPGSSTETSSDSDSSEHDRDRQKYSRHKIKHQQKGKESDSKTRSTDYSPSKHHRGEIDKEKHENCKKKTSVERSKTDFFVNENKKHKESVVHVESITSDKVSQATKVVPPEKRDLKRENESKCEKIETNKYARRTTEEEIKGAKARYLARKLANRR